MTTLDPREIAFRQFFANYPRKVAIAEGRVAFAKALGMTTAEILIASAYKYAIDPNRDPSWTPYPGKWLDRNGWLDLPLPPRKLTPQEIEEAEMAKAKSRAEKEALRNAELDREMAQIAQKAVPMPESVKELRDKLKHKLDI